MSVIQRINQALPLETTARRSLNQRYILILAGLACLIAGTSAIVVLIEGFDVPALTRDLLVLGVNVVALLLLRFRLVRPAATLLVVFYGLYLLYNPHEYVLIATLALIAGAMLGNRWVFAFMNVIVFGRMVANLIEAIPQANGVITPEIFNQLMFIASLGVVSFATRFSIRQTDSAAEAAKSSASLLQAVAESGEILAKMLNLKTLLPRAVELIQERFAFYHVQIFLIDESGEYAALAASTGATGQKLMERRHKLAVGSQSVIGRVTDSGQPVVARDTDPIYYRNELLPNTRSELALPITDGDRIIGALDVQSRRSDAFDTEAVQALQVMANLLGTSIRNARLFDQQARNANETKRLFLEAETNLREIQRLNQQITRQGWEEYLHNKRQVSGVTLQEEDIVAEDTWSEALLKASQSRQAITDHSSGYPVIAVPVMLGTEVIGAIEIEPSNPGHEADMIETVKAVAQRLAISLDKARLFEESQEATAQEQRINEIVGRYQSVTNVDDLLQITLSELSASLGATRGSIRLGIVPAASLNGESQHD
jgi:GAF domain-containing protein